MLVLTRKKEEEIYIGHEIIIKVIEIKHDQVRLGIKAPRDLAIHRSEVYFRVNPHDDLQGS